MTPGWWEQIAEPEQQYLTELGFSPDHFEQLRQRVASGELTPASNRFIGLIEPPAEDDLMELPSADNDERRELERLGIMAIEAGRVAIVILNGGMATRFGGVVKGTVRVVADHSFLYLKLENARKWQSLCRGRIPVFLLNSFATDTATREHVSAIEHKEAACKPNKQPLTIHYLMQDVALRLTANGEVFWQKDGRPALYAPGHGNLVHAWHRSEAAMDWARRKDSLVLVGNVDNVMAGIDPIVIGAHLAHGRPLTVETVRKNPGDVGGAPARVDGRLQVVEGFRFPLDFDQDRISVFSTNTFVVNGPVLAAQHDMTWFHVTKQAEDTPVVQLEQLFNELTAIVNTSFLVVPREGPNGRFLPVKSPADMAAARAAAERSRGLYR